MTDSERFLEKYRSLEAQMKLLAHDDGHVFLPNPVPSGKVEYIFICMEPSLGRWARSRSEAEAKVESGFRNFVYSYEDFILHFAIRKYLCKPGQQYHLTDISKGAMLIKQAAAGRQERYDRWYQLLKMELNLVARPSARVFAVGNSVADFLNRRDFTRPFRKMLHYSRLAAAGRAKAIKGREGQYERFLGSITHRSILGVAEDVLVESGLPADMCRNTLKRLEKSKISESRHQLMFTYKVAFESMD